MRLGLLGGTFNPVHNGHLLIADMAREKYRLDHVLFVPAGLPPHKAPPRTSVHHRLAMLRLAIRGNPHFRVNDWEIRQNRVVYTYETLEHVHRQSPRASLYFIVGSDSLNDLPRWKESAKLKTLARFVSFERILPYASHDLRSRVRQGQSVAYRVPEPVRRYMLKHRLYRRPE